MSRTDLDYVQDPFPNRKDGRLGLGRGDKLLSVTLTKWLYSKVFRIEVCSLGELLFPPRRYPGTGVLGDKDCT